jgi:hypothetical protein
MTEIKDDIKQIGTSAAGKEILEFLGEEMRWFDTQYSALKFAISVAIKFKIPVDEKASVETSHNVNTLDSDLVLKNILLDIYPGEAPYRKSQYLADAGLKFMYQKIKEEEWTLDKFID